MAQQLQRFTEDMGLSSSIAIPIIGHYYLLLTCTIVNKLAVNKIPEARTNKTI